MSIGTFTESFDRPVDPVDRLLRRRVILLSGPIDTERDTWFSAAEALEYGLIDEVAGG